MARPGKARRGEVWHGKVPNGIVFMNSDAMRSSDPLISDAVDKLMQLAGPRGALIPWSVVESTIGIDRYTASWQTIIPKFRKRLLKERSQATLVERAVGIRLLTNEETVLKIPLMRQKRMFRQAKKAICETASANPLQLTMHQRLFQARQIEQFTAQLKELRKQKKEIVHVTQGLPRRTPNNG